MVTKKSNGLRPPKCHLMWELTRFSVATVIRKLLDDAARRVLLFQKYEYILFLDCTKHNKMNVVVDCCLI